MKARDQMQRAFSPNRPMYQQFLDVRSIPFYLLSATCLVSALLFLADFYLGWTLWIVGLVVLLAWMPLVCATMSAIAQQNRWLALLYLLVMAQGAHTIEHTAQFIQIHALGWTGPK